MQKKGKKNLSSKKDRKSTSYEEVWGRKKKGRSKVKTFHSHLYVKRERKAIRRGMGPACRLHIKQQTPQTPNKVIGAQGII